MNWYKKANNVQDTDPTQLNFIIDPKAKQISLMSSIKNKINKQLHALGNLHEIIPIKQIEEILRGYDIILLNEDGTKGSFFLIGGAECGSDEAKSQRADINLGIKGPEDRYIMTRNILSLSWCTFRNGKYEVIMYVS